ncbi:hypothetical protein CPB86DRAFT_605144 [Serendipita vermifera]|nr:hypothetical protein CPB86DRAFT_605144 [Serendipita vermifera]
MVVGTELVSQQCTTTKCTKALDNYDILCQILFEITQFPLDNPPKFLPVSSFLQDISVQRHHNATLLSCCLVSRAWYQPAHRALLHTIILRTCDRDIWFERVPLLAGGRGRQWVQKLVVVGGGDRFVIGIPTWPIWDLFPNVRDVEIFGLEWNTGGLLAQEGLARNNEWLKGVRRLEVTGCSLSETTLCGITRRVNSVDLPNLLRSLSNLETLILKGVRFQSYIPLDDTPPFQLGEITLQRCILNAESFCWLVGGSRDSLVTVTIQETCIWNQTSPQIFTTTSIDEEVVEQRRQHLASTLPGILKKLQVEVPVCEGAWK